MQHPVPEQLQRPGDGPWRPDHPCAGCGYCCANYRVSLHWLETDAMPRDPSLEGTPDTRVPVAMTESLRLHEVAMKGTSSAQPRCIALAGTLGIDAHCSIHPRRPSCCREVAVGSRQCSAARARHNLPPVRLAVDPESRRPVPVDGTGVSLSR